MRLSKRGCERAPVDDRSNYGLFQNRLALQQEAQPQRLSSLPKLVLAVNVLVFPSDFNIYFSIFTNRHNNMLIVEKFMFSLT